MAGKPWFRDGLRFECTGCGDCCTGAPGVVWVNADEVRALATRLGVSEEEFEKKYVRRVGARMTLVEFPNGDCVFFDNQTRKCQVYEDRPRQCRTWPFWQSNVKTEEAWQETCKACPGCGQGDLVPLERIIEQVNVIRL